MICVVTRCTLPSVRSSATGIGVAMRIVVDLNRCLGYAHCVPLAPDVLKLSGEEALSYDPNPDGTERLRVLRAAASCPVQAIIVDRLDSE
jgi:ferredoxin